MFKGDQLHSFILASLAKEHGIDGVMTAGHARQRGRDVQEPKPWTENKATPVVTLDRISGLKAELLF